MERTVKSALLLVITSRAYKNLDELQKRFKKELIVPATAAATAKPSTSDRTARTDRRRTDDDRDPLRVPGRGNRQPPPDW